MPPGHAVIRLESALPLIFSAAISFIGLSSPRDAGGVASWSIPAFEVRRDGAFRGRRGNTRLFALTGSVRAQVEMKSVYNPPQYTECGLEDDWITAGGGAFGSYTDEIGGYAIDVPMDTTYDVNAKLSGRYCRVRRMDGPDASITEFGSPSAPVDFMFDDTNSQPAERDVYYHVNVAHDWICSLDPNFTCLDHPVIANVNLTTGTCGAYTSGGSLYFFKEGGGCNNAARIADIVIHEYGHGITDCEYYPEPPPVMSGMSEAFSDIYAMTINGDPILGENFFSNGMYIRTGLNDRQYPGAECQGDLFCLSEILTGAMWGTRVNLVRKYGDANLYDHLTVETIKNKTRTMPDFLLHLLMNDDDDDDLTNGTPDYAEICDAFAEHNLPCPPVTNYVEITSEPLDDQPHGTGQYPVTAVARAIGGGEIDPSAVRIYCMARPAAPPPVWIEVPMQPTGNPDEYRGEIPHVGPGKHVCYYVRAAEYTGEYATAPSLAPYRNVYEFMTGPYTSFADDLEEDRGWTIHPQNDTAVAGWFERADPTGKSSSEYGVTQPEDDHTPSGTRCFVTDARGGIWSAYDVDLGTTSVVSPLFNWRGDRGVVGVRFWAFLADVIPTDDTLRCAISDNGGRTWRDVFKLAGEGFNDWSFYKGYIGQADQRGFAFTDSMRVRFQMEDLNQQTTCAEAAIDDIEIRVGVGESEAAEDATLPRGLRVDPNRPNPFNPRTTIRFGIPAAGPVTVQVIDPAGRKVRTLLDDRRAAGFHVVEWDGRDGAGHPVGSGVYYYVVRAGENQAGRSMILVK